MTVGIGGRPVLIGLAAVVLLLTGYFAVVTLVSGLEFALAQFGQFWYFIVALAAAWLILLARLEEIDLLQRLPAYRKYMQEVPRFVPRFWRRGR